MASKTYKMKSMSGKGDAYKKTQVPSKNPWLKVASKNLGKSYARRT